MILQITLISFLASFIILSFIRKYLTGGRLSSGDTYFHLHISQYIRRNNWRLPQSLPKVTLDEGGNSQYHYLTYPPLLHYLIAIFPTKYHQVAAKYANLVIISALSTIAANATYLITNNAFIALLSNLIVIFNLSTFELVSTFTPRPIGLLLYSIVVYLVAFYPTNLLALIMISLLTALITLSHKFAVQILVIGMVPFAILFGEPYLVLALFAGFSASIIISRGFYFKILKEHISWLHFYSLYPLKAAIVPKLRQIALRNFWYFALGLSVATLLLSGSFHLSGIMLKALYWTIIPLIAALATSLPALSFLGEEYRYIEYSAVPLAITLLFTLISLPSSISLVILLITSIVPLVALVKYKKYLVTTCSLTNPKDLEAYATLKTAAADHIIVIPHTRTLEISYFTALEVVHPVRTSSSSAVVQVKHLLNNYRIDYVANFRELDKYSLFSIIQGITNLKKVQSFPNFDIYRITKE